MHPNAQNTKYRFASEIGDVNRRFTLSPVSGVERRRSEIIVPIRGEYPGFSPRMLTPVSGVAASTSENIPTPASPAVIAAVCFIKPLRPATCFVLMNHFLHRDSCPGPHQAKAEGNFYHILSIRYNRWPIAVRRAAPLIGQENSGMEYESRREHGHAIAI